MNQMGKKRINNDGYTAGVSELSCRYDGCAFVHKKTGIQIGGYPFALARAQTMMEVSSQCHRTIYCTSSIYPAYLATNAA